MVNFAAFLFQVLTVLAFFTVSGFCASLSWRFPWRIIKTRDVKLRIGWLYGIFFQALVVLAVLMSFVVWAFVHFMR